MAKRVVVLLGEPIQNEDAAAAEAIRPGHLVTLNGSGLVIKHATAGGNTPRNFAMERDEMGKDFDQLYGVGDTVKVAACHQGMRVNALIATGQNIALGALLESAGNGTLRVLAAGTPIARALEAVNKDARLRVELI
jgi:hypothetical protein